jgi:hypothetical protein
VAAKSCKDPDNLLSSEVDAANDGGASDSDTEVSSSATDDEGGAAIIQLASGTGISVNNKGNNNTLRVDAGLVGGNDSHAAAPQTNVHVPSTTANRSTADASMPVCVMCSKAPGLSAVPAMQDLTALKTLAAMFGSESFIQNVPPQGEFATLCWAGNACEVGNSLGVLNQVVA